MAIDVEDLLIQPFRELVEKGKEAVENGAAAEDEDAELSKQMVKASKSVVKEGERALKRLQPLWDSQVEKHGDSFKVSMALNRDLEASRRKLDDLLYDFEDYIEAESFDERRFYEIQSTAKSYALDIIDTVKLLKIDGLPIQPPPKLTAFPPLPPLPPGRTGSRPSSKAITSRDIPHRPSGKILSTEASVESLAHAQGINNRNLAGKPRIETVQQSPSRDTQTLRSSLAVSVDQLPPYSKQGNAYQLHGADDGILAPPIHQDATQPQPAESAQKLDGQRRRPSSSTSLRESRRETALVDETAGSRNSKASAADIPTFPMPRTAAWVGDQTVAPAPFRPRPLPIRKLPHRHAIPEDATVIHAIISSDAPLSPHLAEFGESPVEKQLLPTNRQRHQADNEAPLTPPLADSRASALSNLSSVISSNSPKNVTAPVRGPIIAEVGARSPSLAETNSKRLPPQMSLSPTPTEYEDGVILAEDWKTVTSDRTTSTGQQRTMSHEADCAIGSKSSLFQMKGFCEGAQAFRKGGPWQGIKKTSGYVAGATTGIGRCVSCGYAHQYDELSMDIEQKAAATFTNFGVRFRVRFLYKSHLHATKMTEAYYGCLFCAQTGSVVREDDPTVFASSDQLFKHLSQHPQPLPEVPGLTVLYGVLDTLETDSNSASSFLTGGQVTHLSSRADKPNDFDLHFPSPPQTTSGIPTAIVSEIVRLPAAIAVKDHIQRYGEKKLSRPDGAVELLQFFIGARIIGVEYPARWQGKWAAGWHDGHWGAFPAKSVELEWPSRRETPPMVQFGSSSSDDLKHLANGVTSVVTLQTRWKWDLKDAADKGWLAFDKGETIKNVAWLERDHWCWSGMNSKGKFGIFPRSHVKMESVKEQVVALGGPTSKKSSSASRPVKLFSRARRVSTSAASSISGGSGVVEIIP